MTLTDEQRMAGLEVANRIRRARSELRLELREMPRAEGLALLADLLLNLPEFLGSTRTEVALLWPHRMYGRDVERLLEVAEVFDSRVLGALSVRQRGLLADGLRALADRS